MDAALARLLVGERTAKPAATPDAGAKHEALIGAARDFESWFVAHWLQQASKPMLDDTALDGGQAGRMYRDEWQSELARHATAGRGLGFADAIVRNVERVSQNGSGKESNR
jgi:Rod binding domain-containing protein